MVPRPPEKISRQQQSLSAFFGYPVRAQQHTWYRFQCVAELIGDAILSPTHFQTLHGGLKMKIDNSECGLEGSFGARNGNDY
jgi:hypothetical protein